MENKTSYQKTLNQSSCIDEETKEYLVNKLKRLKEKASKFNKKNWNNRGDFKNAK